MIASRAYRYSASGSGTSWRNAGDLFDAIADDLISHGDLDTAMQKAFRWGWEREDRNEPGLRDLLQRLRETAVEADVDGAGERVQLGDDAETPTTPSRKDVEALSSQLKQVESLADLDLLDAELVDSILSDAEREWIDQWKRMPAMMVEAGLAVSVGKRLELTPQAVRRIGNSILKHLFVPPERGLGGAHESGLPGRHGMSIESSRSWEWGAPFELHLSRTILNAVLRNGSNTGVSLSPEDFEVMHRESGTSASTCLLIDMSRSMHENGFWEPAKRTALALDAMIRSRFRRDELDVIGFSSAASTLSLHSLPGLAWDEFTHGTNLQAGLSLARRRLVAQRGRSRHIIILTDGEPTAITVDGQVVFEHPASARIYRETLAEVGRCTRENISITTFALGREDSLRTFMMDLTRVNRGRMIETDADNLGRYVLRDLVRSRTLVVG